MLRSETLFGKREPNSPTPNSPLNSAAPQPGSAPGSVKPGGSPVGMAPGAAPQPASQAPVANEGGSKLIPLSSLSPGLGASSWVR